MTGQKIPSSIDGERNVHPGIRIQSKGVTNRYTLAVDEGALNQGGLVQYNKPDRGKITHD